LLDLYLSRLFPECEELTYKFPELICIRQTRANKNSKTVYLDFIVFGFKIVIKNNKLLDWELILKDLNL